MDWRMVLLFLIGQTVVSSGSSTLLIYRNACPITIFPSLIATGGSLEINSSTSLGAIAPFKELEVPLPDAWLGFGFFRTGCISNGKGFSNCTNANCEGRDCTAEDQLVATIFSISSEGYIISVKRGYNVGLTMEFMCKGCNCPSLSCKAQLDMCPNNISIFNSSGAVAACKLSPDRELIFSEDRCIFPGYSSGPRTTCTVKDLSIMIMISC